MRWTKKKDGDKRVVERFALVPITIGDETRWLEWCTIAQTYISTWTSQGELGMWSDDCFLNK